ncbi:MAG: biotin--[acetyl-CoA-carboxylase] ligase [Haloarculaceae archaeon]
MQETRRRVLDALADGPVTGPALADELGVSRAAVWKHVEALREAGFTVESGDEGYVLAGVPDYGAPAIEYTIDAAYAVEFHDALDSTNRRARELAAEGAGDVAVVAGRQTGGRGRLDREWASPPGGVYVSLLLRPAVPPAHAPVYTLAAAVATADAVDGLIEDDVRIKWPNDVLAVDGASERKLAGILTEMEGEADRVSWLVVGVGVNANVDEGALPPGGTSLQARRRAAGRSPVAVSRRELLAALLDRFEELTGDLDAVVPVWRERANTLGRRVRVETPDGPVEGEAVDVEFPGTLVVRADDGTEVQVTAGDCEHLRPAAE